MKSKASCDSSYGLIKQEKRTQKRGKRDSEETILSELGFKIKEAGSVAYTS